tara:strand:+ start:827 stop:1162 length:336 start_codon:yes stop_codon:yes gene_type:complete
MVFLDDVVISKTDEGQLTSGSYGELRVVFNGTIPEQVTKSPVEPTKTVETFKCGDCILSLYEKIIALLAYVMAIASFPLAQRFRPEYINTVSGAIIVLMTLILGFILRKNI